MVKLLKELIAIIDNYIHKSLLCNVIDEYKRDWQQNWNDEEGFAIDNRSVIQFRHLEYNSTIYLFVHKIRLSKTGNVVFQVSLPKRYFYSNGTCK
jgi:hypothetical protein